MFKGIVPPTIEFLIERTGLLVYSARIVPAKGGPLLVMGAQYPYQKKQIPPLDEDRSLEIQEALIETFQSRGYKLRINNVEYDDVIQPNIFSIKILLKEKDIDAELYGRIKAAYRERRDRNKL